MASSPVAEDPEEEVQFVSEGPLRPVLECIDLLSDAEDEDYKTPPKTIDEQIDRQKAQVASTLDKLARQVAVKKQETAEKCRAFKEKIISQQAHGRQELAFSRNNGNNYDAKRCVDMWLKIPGPKPGVLNCGPKWGRRKPTPHPNGRDGAHTCPVINCGRVYDNVPLLEGHLKRFDHSPCDPTVLLRGSPSALYACVACCGHFDTKQEWRLHRCRKTSSPSAEEHISPLTCQVILCFACPACYLLFNIRDECLQHMAAKNHFVQSIRDGFNDTDATVTPVPIPRYAKNCLIALCKEVAFRVRCTLCRKVLRSHMEARAHFNVQCREGGAIAESDRTVAEVMTELQAQGRCSQCWEIFRDRGQIERHKQLTKHEVEVAGTVEKSILQYCSYYESLRLQNSTSQCADPERALKKERDEEDSAHWSPAKRQKLSLKKEPAGEGAVAWCCECGLRFPEESFASKHLMAANKIFLKCGVCGKRMGESSIARLHMSRMHGGAHLSNLSYWCHCCRVEMPQLKDILSHVNATHQGHTFYREQEVAEKEEEEEEEPSSSFGTPSSSAGSSTSGAPRTPPSKPSEKWLCRMCEDLFESRAAVKKHCQDTSSHSFQKFLCGHCHQKFYKEATVRRHCANEHDGRVHVRYFCGLCDGIQYDSEAEFLEHYRGLHGEDYCCVEDAPSSPAPGPSATEAKSASQRCSCMGREMEKVERRAVFTRCMKRLANEGLCSYACAECGEPFSSYREVKVHLQVAHGTSRQEQALEVVCGSCLESYADVPGFHNHYHSQHCSVKPCSSSRVGGGNAAAATAPLTLDADEISPEANAEEFEDVKHAIAVSSEEAENVTEADGDTFEEDLKCALALSAEEARTRTEFDRDIKEALERSLQEF